jgi:hypothetical protein
MKITKFYLQILIFSACFCFYPRAGTAQNHQTLQYSKVSAVEVIKIAQQFINDFPNGEMRSIVSHRELVTENALLAHIFDFYPTGYLIVSASYSLPPVIAYSAESQFGGLSKENPLHQLLTADLGKRYAYAEMTISDYAERNRLKWESFLTNDMMKANNDRFEQWPSDSDGWLKTNWTQNSPYNTLCPLDPVTSQRSIAGCPAVAMAMILNFNKTTNNTQFDDNDDYYHNYAGRQYWIDDDYITNDFPSFPQLNEYLDTLNLHYLNNIQLTDQDKAALTFASGVACKQVFTSQASGTFGVQQAFDAYLRFGFTTISLLDENDTDLFDRLMQNIKDTMPAHLAVVDSAWSMGHNVVVDGYNTNNFYHINFGWGGTYNGWYLLPDDIPYGLTVIEGVVVDITPPDYTGTDACETKFHTITSYPNPTGDILMITLPDIDNQALTLSVYDPNGLLIFEINDIEKNEIEVNVSHLSGGIYFFVLSNNKENLGNGKFVVE